MKRGVPMKRGFTLVEMLVVMVVIATVTAVTVPAITRLNDEDELTGAPRELVTLLERARATSVEQGVPVTMTIDPASGRYWVRVGQGLAPEVFRTGTVSLGPGVTLASTLDRITFSFDPLGPAHGDSLYVRAPSGGALIRVERWTGRLYVRE